MMMIGNRKEERRVCTILLHVIRKSPTPTENRLAFFSSELLSKSNPGFKPGLPRQNAIALPLVPPPLPGKCRCWSRIFPDKLLQCSLQTMMNKEPNGSSYRGDSQLAADFLQFCLFQITLQIAWLNKAEGFLMHVLCLKQWMQFQRTQQCQCDFNKHKVI